MANNTNTNTETQSNTNNCCICLETFKQWEVNSLFCCSAFYCKSCIESVKWAGKCAGCRKSFTPVAMPQPRLNFSAPAPAPAPVPVPAPITLPTVNDNAEYAVTITASLINPTSLRPIDPDGKTAKNIDWASDNKFSIIVKTTTRNHTRISRKHFEHTIGYWKAMEIDETEIESVIRELIEHHLPNLEQTQTAHFLNLDKFTYFLISKNFL